MMSVRISNSPKVWLSIVGTKKTCVAPYASKESARNFAPVWYANLLLLLVGN